MSILERYFQNEDRNRIFCEILSFFLPLDIDMQALELLCNDEEKRKRNDHIKYLKDMLKDAEDGFYKKKWDNCKSEAVKLLEQIPKGDNKNKLVALLGITDGENSCIYGFLNMLDENKGKDIKEDKVTSVISYFENQCHVKYWNDINSFHNWYCSLAECLRGESLCQEEIKQ